MKFKKIVRETSDLDDMDYEIAQKMQDFAKKNIPEVRSVVSGSVTGQLYVMLKPDVYIMADEAKEIARELIRASGAHGYRYVGVNKADPYIVIARRGVAVEGSEMHPEITCDRCGFTSRQEDYFDIEGDEILCDQCRRGIASEAMKKKSRTHSKDTEKGWFGIKDAKFIYHGDWNDPEVEYKGVSLNYWDIESGLLEIYREEHPEDRNDKGFDKWMADHPEEIKSELDLHYDAEMEYRAEHPEEFGDDDLGEYDESWIGDKAREGWKKVKSGAKKMAKAVGDAFKGPFRKGDHIVMRGEDGEEFKGTIKSFDLGDKTYEVLLGNPVNEDWASDDLVDDERFPVKAHGDAITELEDKIENAWVSLEAHGADVDRIMELVQNYIKLYELEPERAKSMLGA